MKTLEQLYDGAFLIHTTVGGRPLQLPLLIGDGCAVLIDTGSASDIANAILPALAQVGSPAANLTHVINTHCDFDHVGGNSALLQTYPDARLLCGAADRALIENPEVMIRLRYDAYREQHDIFYDDATLAFIRRELGASRVVDGVLRGGERLRIGPDRELEILALPGHSRGHVGVFDRKHHVLFGGDAIHGRVYLDHAGRPALCPTYLHVQPYLDTIRTIEGLALKAYVGCHWPVKRGAEIAAFCAESRSFVEDAERLILAELGMCRSGVSLRELCERIGPRLGSWPASVHIELCYAFAGHLADLVERHAIIENRSARPFTYSL